MSLDIRSPPRTLAPKQPLLSFSLPPALVAVAPEEISALSDRPLDALPRPVTPVPTDQYSLSDIPTNFDSFTRATQDSFALSLDHIDDRIRVKLDQPFGKDNLTQCFSSEPCLRHVLLPLWRSGHLQAEPYSYQRLQLASPDAFRLHHLLRKYGDISFNSIRGFPPGWNSETTINEPRVAMTTAALIHFNGSVADAVRWIGGPHVAAHRDHPAILRRVVASGASPDLVSDLRRILLHGIPAKCNVSSTEANFQAFYQYGNHKTLMEEPAKTYKALVKDNRKGYTLLFDPALIPFLLNCHVTPQGIVDLNTLHKNPRPIFDSSFRPQAWCMAINDWTNKDYEPPLTFADAEMAFMIWLYNLRVTYPASEIYLADDDVSGAFRQTKYHPNLVGMHTSVQCGYGVLNTGATFGDNTSPSQFNPIAEARRHVSRHLWLTDHGVISRTLPHLPPITTAPAPPATITATFATADPDAINTGVLSSSGERIPPPYSMHVDDCLCRYTPQSDQKCLCQYCRFV